MGIKVVKERRVEGDRISSTGYRYDEVKVIKPGEIDEDPFERSKRLGWLDLEAIDSAKTLVVGAGAIGNEVVKNLVLSGFRHITIVDMDHVVRANLNRCVFFRPEDADNKRAKAEVVAQRAGELMGGDLEIDYHVKPIEELGDEFIPSFDIVFGCLDNLAARLHLNAHCFYSNTPYIDGGTLGMSGKVQVIVPPETPCLECTVNKSHLDVLEKRYSCTGVDVHYVEPKLAAEITTTAVIGAVEVREAIKILSGLRDRVIPGIFYYDALRNESYIMDVEINPACPHHALYAGGADLGGGMRAI